MTELTTLNSWWLCRREKGAKGEAAPSKGLEMGTLAHLFDGFDQVEQGASGRVHYGAVELDGPLHVCAAALTPMPSQHLARPRARRPTGAGVCRLQRVLARFPREALAGVAMPWRPWVRQDKGRRRVRRRGAQGEHAQGPRQGPVDGARPGRWGCHLQHRGSLEVPRKKKAPVRAAAVWGDMETLKDDISESEWAHYDADAPTPTPEQDAAVLEPVLEEEERREVVPANPSPPSSAQTLLRARGAARSPRDAARSLGTTPEDTHGITCIVRSRRAGGGFCGSGEAAGAGRGGGTTAGPRQGRGEETETSRQGHPKGRAELDQAQKGRWQVLFLACSKDRSVCTSQRLLILLF